MSQDVLHEDNGEDCINPRRHPCLPHCHDEGWGEAITPMHMGHLLIGQGEMWPWNKHVSLTSSGIKPGCFGQSGIPWPQRHLEASDSWCICCCLKTKIFPHQGSNCGVSFRLAARSVSLLQSITLGPSKWQTIIYIYSHNAICAFWGNKVNWKSEFSLELGICWTWMQGFPSTGEIGKFLWLVEDGHQEIVFWWIQFVIVLGNFVL